MRRLSAGAAVFEWSGAPWVRIQQCVGDVLLIANQFEDFSRAKKRLEQLFDESKASHRGHRWRNRSAIN
jgi:hypothetical protein